MGTSRPPPRNNRSYVTVYTLMIFLCPVNMGGYYFKSYDPNACANFIAVVGLQTMDLYILKSVMAKGGWSDLGPELLTSGRRDRSCEGPRTVVVTATRAGGLYDSREPIESFCPRAEFGPGSLSFEGVALIYRAATARTCSTTGFLECTECCS
ncbi:hypothetical protein EVAR_92640_1 [Eumeta japonica]|uniref:Uncharacterized protein n=1 Tax=Eumeta variegata TaxID=151549 RepID=A0A4C1SZL0_EUMVA|nr:hypothetical protein EVAR_92640_1 [Eumeta japonica]